MTKTSQEDTRVGRALTGSRALAVGAGVVGTMLGWVLTGPVAGIELAIQLGPAASDRQQVGPAMVLAVSLLVGLAAWGLLVVLEQRARRARRTWTILALLVLVLSLAGPLTAGITVADKAGLALLHIVLAAVLIPLLRRRGSDRTR